MVQRYSKENEVWEAEVNGRMAQIITEIIFQKKTPFGIRKRGLIIWFGDPTG